MNSNPPCKDCQAICCRYGASNVGYSVLLEEGEESRFPEAITLSSVRQGGDDEWGLPTKNGKCVHLVQNQCQIYDRRPQGCIDFDCRNLTPTAFMLQEHPELVQLLIKAENPEKEKIQ